MVFKLKRKFRISEGSFLKADFLRSPLFKNRKVQKMKAVIRSANRNTTCAKEFPEPAYTIKPVRE